MSFKGNPEHLKTLKKAIKKKNITIWNSYNFNLLKKDEKADLEEVNLMHLDLELIDLRWANLKKANLSKANLLGADLEETNLKRANLIEQQ